MDKERTYIVEDEAFINKLGDGGILWINSKISQSG